MRCNLQDKTRWVTGAFCEYRRINDIWRVAHSCGKRWYAQVVVAGFRQCACCVFHAVANADWLFVCCDSVFGVGLSETKVCRAAGV